jgi:hypothetical protein
MSDDQPETEASTKTFAEAYTLRNNGRGFFALLGEAGKALAEAYREADLDNQAHIKDLAFEAMVHSLVEHHGYTREEVLPQVIDYFASGMAARVGM